MGYARNHAAYILREENYSSKKEDFVYGECGNMNFTDGTGAIKFWEYADTYERENSVVYRELELNIPNELNHEQAKELIQVFVEKELGKDYPYTYAIHESHNEQEEKNLHCHLMFSERENDGINRDLTNFFKRANSKNPHLGGAKKNRDWQKKERLLELRKSWEIEQNKALEKYGFETRVDCRSLKDIRQELLESGLYKEAEKYNRTPINIAGKILYKVANGIELSTIEKEQYGKHLKNIERKKELDQRGQENFDKATLQNEIRKLEQSNSFEKAVNILTKGEYFRTKKEFFQLNKIIKKSTSNEILENKVLDLQNKISILENKAKLSSKFSHIYSELEVSKNAKLTHLKERYQDTYKEKFLTKEEENFLHKYRNYDIEKLKVKLETLQGETSISKAINVLSGYKYNSNLVDLFELEEKGNEIQKEYRETSMYSPKLERLRELFAQNEANKKMIFEKKEEILKLVEEIPDDKINNLAEKIEKERNIEIQTLKSYIQEKEQTSSSLQLAHEKIKLLQRHQNLEKLYNQEIEKEEKEHKKIYSISSEIRAVEKILSRNYKNIEVDKETWVTQEKEIQGEIKKNSDKIELSQKVIQKMEIILNAKHEKSGVSGVEIFAIGKLSQGEYWHNFREQKEIRKQLETSKKALESASPFSFGKSLLRKNIDLYQGTLSKLEDKERRIIKHAQAAPNYKAVVKNIESKFQEVIESHQNNIIKAKVENKINYTLINSANSKKEITAKKRNPVRYAQELKGSSAKGFKKSIKNNLTNTEEIHSTLNIRLKKENENEWEI